MVEVLHLQVASSIGFNLICVCALCMVFVTCLAFSCFSNLNLLDFIFLYYLVMFRLD